MAEYIEREAVCYQLAKQATIDGQPRAIRRAAKIVAAFPAADVVEVVRCRDCRHRDPEDHKCDSGELPRAGCIFSVPDNYFCAYGVRAGGESNETAETG